MDRFDPNNVRYDFDIVEPIRTGSFDLTFGPTHNDTHSHNQSETLTLHIEDGIPSYTLCPSPKLKATASFRSKGGIGILQNAEMITKLEQRASDAIPLNDSEHPFINWKLTKTVHAVNVYELSIPTVENVCFPAASLRITNAKSTIGFRISCEMRSDIRSIMNCISAIDSSDYNDMENRISNGHLHAAIIKSFQTEHLTRNDLPPPKLVHHSKSHSPSEMPKRDVFPRVAVKWHACRFFGRFHKPADMCFVEHSDIQRVKHNLHGRIYFCSVETLSSKELMTRFQSGKCIPSNVSKCKRVIIRNGLYQVTPTDTPGHHRVSLMVILDHQNHYSHYIAHKIVALFTNRMIAIRNFVTSNVCQSIAEEKRNRSASLPRYFGREHDSKYDDEVVTSSQCSVCSCPSKITKLQSFCDNCGRIVCDQCNRNGDSHTDTQMPVCATCLQEQCRHTTMDRMSKLGLGTSPFVSLLSEPESFQVASGISNKVDTQTAVRSAFGQMYGSLNDRFPHVMIVSYSIEYEANDVQRELQAIAPNCIFIGSTSDIGLFTQSKSIHHGRAIAIFGIYDPKGAYGVVNADFQKVSVEDGTTHCLKKGIQQLALQNEEKPDLIWLSISHGNENTVIQQLNELQGTSVILAGGSLRDLMPVDETQATQICSHATECDNVTTRGVSMALCCPSVQILHTLFTCYEPISTKTLKVTHTYENQLKKLNGKPALHALDHACCGILHECVSHPQKYDISSNLTPLYYPLGRESSKSHRFQIIQPIRAEKDLSLSIDVAVNTSDKLRLMSIDVDSTREHFVRNLGNITQTVGIHGCLLTASSNYIRLEQNQTRRSIASIMWKLIPSCALLGTISDGQHGHLAMDEDAVHANGMISAVLFTSMKK